MQPRPITSVNPGQTAARVSLPFITTMSKNAQHRHSTEGQRSPAVLRSGLIRRPEASVKPFVGGLRGLIPRLWVVGFIERAGVAWIFGF
jgi:hypothetical protein